MERENKADVKKSIKWLLIIAVVLLIGMGVAYLLFGCVKIDTEPSQPSQVIDVKVSEEDLTLTETMEDMISFMAPALVQVYRADDEGNYTAGSGYIMEITEDTIYICTNRHAVTTYGSCSIYFYDGTCLEGQILGAAEYYDVGVVTIQTSQVPEELMAQIKPVTIDLTYWETLDEEPIELGLGRVDRAGGFAHITTGNLIKIKQDFEWDFAHPHTEVTVALVAGDSGSAVLDYNGNLIGMAYAYSTEPTRYWCVPLDEILSCYYEITGRYPHVY